MKPSIFKITGGHLTARDKRNILDCVTPDGERPHFYGVCIRENYKTDWGEKRHREWTFTVEAKGVAPLLPVPQKAEPQGDLFEKV
jgi:hypothetical protein